MRKIAGAIAHIGAAVAVMAALCGQPAVAGDASSGANEKIGQWQVRGHPARFAALARQGSPCDRPVVLILGIGF